MGKLPQSEPPKLTVSNFGPIATAEIDLRSLTVFVGPSNTGKSYLAILIYALHKFFEAYTGSPPFKFDRRPLKLHRSTNGEQPFDYSNASRLVEWVKNNFLQVDDKSSSDASPIQLPDFIVSMVRSVFSDENNFSKVIAEDIKRNFGIDNTAMLVRHSSRDGAKIALRFKPLEYELILKRGKPEGSVIAISEEIPLYIDLYSRRVEEVLFWVRDATNSLALGHDDRARQNVSYFISEFFSLVLSNIVSPFHISAHYLPADRTSVMHIHRTFVTSLIERAPHAGLRRDKFPPTLSGVLADFVKNLVELGEPIMRGNHMGNLAARLEQQILKGDIQRKESETGYPIFSYLPHGWRTDLPLMNASSMVSELAPVVLYLRHIVQSGDVLIIEEPESHLHPAMQVDFIRQLAAVVHAGVRVVLTTHSEWVLDELANLVRLSELPKGRRKGIAGADFPLSRDQVGVWLFEPKQRPKGSVVKEIPCDVDYGGYRSGFDEVALGTYNKYAEISNRVEGIK